MTAPDKIWVREFAEGVNQMWSHIKATKTSAIAQHEYIRKEALLEYLTNKMEQMRIEAKGCYNMTAAGKFLALKNLVEKIESL